MGREMLMAMRRRRICSFSVTCHCTVDYQCDLGYLPEVSTAYKKVTGPNVALVCIAHPLS